MKLPEGITLASIDGRLSLGLDQDPTAGSLFVDFVSARMTHRIRQGSGGEAVVKAVGGCVPAEAGRTVIDATAGLGEDAFLLASAGWYVSLIEQSPVIHALLTDGLLRARREAADSGDAVLQAILDRMVLLEPGDSAQLMRQLPPADVVYLDPMFPERLKSARVKKNRYLLQHLHGDEAQGEFLLPVALEQARKVVVKRPRLAPALNNMNPASARIGKTSRFDIYVGRVGVGRVGVATSSDGHSV